MAGHTHTGLTPSPFLVSPASGHGTPTSSYAGSCSYAGTGDGKEAGDAGAAFVLESKGTWWHAGFHLTTAMVGPTVLTLPYALRGMGWGLGLAALTAVAAVTFYTYYLMSSMGGHRIITMGIQSQKKQCKTSKVHSSPATQHRQDRSLRRPLPPPLNRSLPRTGARLICLELELNGTMG
ncbi:hypothetical protein ACQ4PT_055462 [Festuca glaucescens]